MAVKIVCLDLDGTVLNDKKEITVRTMAALERAAAQGAWIVPATGRYYMGIPAQLREAPFVRYAITCNGACIYDGQEQQVLERHEIPLERAFEILDFLDSHQVLYDCFVDSCCYTEPWYMDRLQEFFDDPVFIETFRRLRHPCPEGLRPFLREKGMPLQKINTYYRDDAHKAEVEQAYDRLFPDLVITSSGKRNLELNIASATKGGGLRALCRIRGVDPAEAVAFGDGTNDASMIQAAGLGVAMGNAAPELIAVADRVTLSNNEDGVAVLLEELLAQ